MSSKLKQKKKKTASVVQSLYEFFGQLLSLILLVYLFLILVVMPFYATNGYVSIGTDKANFFKENSLRMGSLALPVILVFCVLGVILYFQKRKSDMSKKSLIKDLLDIFKANMSVTDVFALLFAGSLILSYSCSDYKEQALWGAQGWYIGLAQQLILVLLYFLLSKAWKPNRWMILSVLPVSVIVFVIGYLNRFDVHPIKMEAANPSFISTIGNINWYCGYLVTVFFGVVALLWQGEWKNKWQKYLLILYLGIGFATLVTQGSASGILTLAVMLLIIFCLSGGKGKRMENFWLIAVIMSLACLVTYVVRQIFPGNITFEDRLLNLLTDSFFVFFITIFSGIMFGLVCYLNQKGSYPERMGQFFARCLLSILILIFIGFVSLIVVNTLCPGEVPVVSNQEVFTFTPDWGSNRGATWMAGVKCFWEQNILHKLVGVGPDCMSAFLYQEGSVELVTLVRKQFGTATLTNAHNEWLTVLVNLGIFGAISYIGMMMSAIVRYIQTGKHNLIVLACGFSLLAYTINNMFSFQQMMNLPLIFIVLGIGEAYLKKSKASKGN